MAGFMDRFMAPLGAAAAAGAEYLLPPDSAAAQQAAALRAVLNARTRAGWSEPEPTDDELLAAWAAGDESAGARYRTGQRLGPIPSFEIPYRPTAAAVARPAVPFDGGPLLPQVQQQRQQQQSTQQMAGNVSPPVFSPAAQTSNAPQTMAQMLEQYRAMLGSQQPQTASPVEPIDAREYLSRFAPPPGPQLKPWEQAAGHLGRIFLQQAAAQGSQAFTGPWETVEQMDEERRRQDALAKAEQYKLAGIQMGFDEQAREQQRQAIEDQRYAAEKARQELQSALSFADVTQRMERQPLDDEPLGTVDFGGIRVPVNRQNIDNVAIARAQLGQSQARLEYDKQADLARANRYSLRTTGRPITPDDAARLSAEFEKEEAAALKAKEANYVNTLRTVDPEKALAYKEGMMRLTPPEAAAARARVLQRRGIAETYLGGVSGGLYDENGVEIGLD